jgi:hypothetical protein
MSRTPSLFEDPGTAFVDATGDQVAAGLEVAERARGVVTVWRDSRGSGLCRACHAPLAWFRTVLADKAIPFNAHPVEFRTYQDVESGRQVLELSASDAHWATCPQASRFRKRTR